MVQIPGRKHVDSVAELAALGASTRGFPAAMRSIGVTTTLRPDAWFMRVGAHELLVYEITVSEPLTYRGEAYKALMRELVQAGWRAVVFEKKRGVTSRYMGTERGPER